MSLYNFWAENVAFLPQNPRKKWTFHSKLLGAFNPSEEYESKWESSPDRGENENHPENMGFFQKCLKIINPPNFCAHFFCHELHGDCGWRPMHCAVAATNKARSPILHPGCCWQAPRCHYSYRSCKIGRCIPKKNHWNKFPIWGFQNILSIYVPSFVTYCSHGFTLKKLYHPRCLSCYSSSDSHSNGSSDPPSPFLRGTRFFAFCKRCPQTTNLYKPCCAPPNGAQLSSTAGLPQAVPLNSASQVNAFEGWGRKESEFNLGNLLSVLTLI